MASSTAAPAQSSAVKPHKPGRQRTISVGGAILIVVYTLLPIAWIVSLSLKTGGDINNKKFLPKHWSLDNYRTVFKAHIFLSALRNSIGIALISTLIGVVVAMFAAYAIAR